ncbi:hypothetical protein [Actinoplanes sp. NPDC051851]|uniref:hypothetical protein n=1 Tax=Actinoplanes sp. NPDC051851 TaxID=3154753 RepID=UPI0034234CE9
MTDKKFLWDETHLDVATQAVLSPVAGAEPDCAGPADEDGTRTCSDSENILKALIPKKTTTKPQK